MSLSKSQKDQVTSQFYAKAVETIKAEGLLGTAFGMESVVDKNSDLAQELVKVLDLEAREAALNIVRGERNGPVKVKAVWERYMPTELTDDEQRAVDYIRKNDNYAWENFISLPEIERALIEDVALGFLNDLTESRSFVQREAELLEDWKRHCTPEGAQAPGGYYAMAEQLVDRYMRTVFPDTDLNNPANKDGLAAFKVARMAAYRKLAAHFTGEEEFDMAPELGGAYNFNKKIKSSTLDNFSKISRDNQGKASMLSFVKIGHVRSARYDIPEKREFKRLLDGVFQESDARAAVPGKNPWDHPVQQITDVVCPLLAMPPQKLRQKKMDVASMYKLYCASEKLAKLSYSSIFPLLGKGMKLPKQLPPEFVERFDDKWRRDKMLTLGNLAYAGFNVVVHRSIKRVIDDMFKELPEMQVSLQSPDTLSLLKNARTFETFVRPVKEMIIQRHIIQGYKQMEPKAYEAAEEAATKRLVALNLPPKEHQVEMRSELFRSALGFMVENKKRAENYMEKFLLGNTEINIVRMAVPENLRWAHMPGMPTPQGL